MAQLFPVILSGGAGSRLWPLSTKAKPKQHHALTGNESMLAQTLKRVVGLSDVEVGPAMIVGSAQHAEISHETLSRCGVEGGQVVCEPSGKNTAPAAALACALAVEQDPDALVLLLPSDHHIGHADAFRRAVSVGAGVARAGTLVAFGIRPTRPETGYGYIARGPETGPAFEISRFVEKPALEAAETMLAAGGYDWNAGIFLFHAKTFLDELQAHRPDMAQQVSVALGGAERSPAPVTITPDPDAWDAIEGDSIDYAVMQETRVGRVVPVDMDWSDLGSFQSLWELSDRDTDGNALTGDVLSHGTTGSYVRAAGGRPVAVVGCEDMVVIDTGQAVLVMPRARAQEVKQVVTRLKLEGRDADY